MYHTDSMLRFIAASPSVFHAIDNFRRSLLAAGYQELFEADAWALTPGGKYFVTRNGSSLLSFRLPRADFAGFQLAAAHSDAPTFKIKENPELPGQLYVRLNTEKYGGMLMSTWFDRPLSVAGRLLMEENGRLAAKLVNVDRDLLIIPSLAIHMNRAANEGMKYLANVDTLPLLGGPEAKGGFMALVGETAGVKQEAILGHDLFLYLRQAGTKVGLHEEFVACPKLDDLACAYGCMEGFLAAAEGDSVPVCAIFDNEEVGSGTKQGALSTFLPEVLQRICAACGKSSEDYNRAVARSFLVSADNAHAIHPNHPEYADGANAPVMNGGIVIKYNANQKYTTDAVSAALFKALCRETEVAVQTYANRSDLPGGSTLGNLANTQVSLNTVDIGLPQLAMHSAYETAGAKDLEALVKAMTVYFAKSLESEQGQVFWA